MGCTPCKEEEAMYINKPQFHTPKKRIDQMDGVNRPNSFVEQSTPQPTKGEYKDTEGNNRLEKVQSLDETLRKAEGGGEDGAKLEMINEMRESAEVSEHTGGTSKEEYANLKLRQPVNPLDNADVDRGQ